MRKATAPLLHDDLLSRYVLGAMRLAPLVAVLMWAVREQPARLVGAILLAGMLEAYLLAKITRTWRMFFLVGFPLFLIDCLYAFYTQMYGTPPGRSLAFILLTVSPEEILGFLTLPQSRLPALGLLGVLALYGFVAWKLARESRIEWGDKSLVGRGLLALMLLVTLWTATYPNDLIDGIADSPTTGTAMFFTSTLPRANAVLHASEVVKVLYHAHREAARKLTFSCSEIGAA